MDSEILYRVIIPMRRSADLEEVAVVTTEQWEKMKRYEGKELYFGEIAGKHSEVRGTLEMEEIQVLSRDPEEIFLFKRWFPELRIGALNIMQAIEHEEEKEEENRREEELLAAGQLPGY